MELCRQHSFQCESLHICNELRRFKQSVAVQSQSEDEENVSSVFSQWVADNCDHNANTLDGKGEFQDKLIKIKHLLKSSEVTKQARIKIN